MGSLKSTLLIVSGGIEAVPGIRRAKELGLHVVVSDGSPTAPGFELADARLIASTYDVERTVAAARQYHTTTRPIDGVMCIASDVPLTVASVAAALDLPGIPVEAARLAIDKVAMKERLQACGVAVPWFHPVSDSHELRRLVTTHGYPLVIKPVDSRGARGVLRLTGATDLDWAYETARSHSPTGRVLIEAFLSGPQVSTESLVLDGVACTPGFADRNYEFLDKYAPHIIENGGELPSALPAATQDAVRALIGPAAAALGIHNGVVKGDIVVHEGKPYVIEIAARLSGGYFCTTSIPLNTCVDLVGCAIRLALGEPVDPAELQPRCQRGVAQRFLFPEPGRVVAISGAEQVSARPGIVLCEVRVDVGAEVKAVDSHPARAGVVMAIGETREQALDRAVAAASDIVIRTRAS